MRRICPVCGEAFVVDEKLEPNRKYCNMACYRKSIGADKVTRAKKKYGETAKRRKDRIYMPCRIRIVKPIDIFDSLRPRVGSEWKAEKYMDAAGYVGYVIKNGKRINIREDECREVKR